MLAADQGCAAFNIVAHTMLAADQGCAAFNIVAQTVSRWSRLCCL